MTTKLIKTISYMTCGLGLGTALIILSAFIKLPIEYDLVRYIPLLIGVSCLAFAVNDCKDAIKIAKLLDAEHEATKQEITNLEIRIQTIRSLLDDNNYVQERVDVAYFKRDKYGNRFMPGHFYSTGEITALNDNRTVEEIRKAIEREMIQVGDGTIHLDDENRVFRFDNPNKKS